MLLRRARVLLALVVAVVAGGVQLAAAAAEYGGERVATDVCTGEDGVFRGDCGSRDWTGCSTVEAVLLEGASVDVSCVAQVERVVGSVELSYTALRRFVGLPRLVSIGGDLSVFENGDLTEWDAMGSLREIGGRLDLHHQPRLERVAPLRQLSSVGSLQVRYHDGLEDLDWLPGLRVVRKDLTVSSNTRLRSVGSLAGLEEVGDLYVQFNRDLESLDLSALRLVRRDVSVNGNGALSALRGSPPAFPSRGFSVGGSLLVENNGALREVVLANLVGVGGSLVLFFNPGLERLALDQLVRAAAVRVVSNGALPDLDGFGSLRSVGTVFLADNARLRSACWVSLREVTGAFRVSGSPVLCPSLESVLAGAVLSEGLRCQAQSPLPTTAADVRPFVCVACPARGPWPPTLAGRRARMVPCGPGISGFMERDCGSDGQWQPPEEAGCRAAAAPEVGAVAGAAAAATDELDEAARADTLCTEDSHPQANCTCPPGFRRGGPSGCQAAMDSCGGSGGAGGACGENSECVATPLGPVCSCRPGYAPRVDGAAGCLDVNECALHNGGCYAGAECVNLPGSRVCRCPRGFAGDGIARCWDVNECLVGNGGCAAGSRCENLRGSFRCDCSAVECPGGEVHPMTCHCSCPDGLRPPCGDALFELPGSAASWSTGTSWWWPLLAVLLAIFA